MTDYTYDNSGQLTGETHTYQTNESFTYDATGNRTNTTYTTGTNNSLASDGTYNYEYDDNGNRTKKSDISTSESVVYLWDHRDRLDIVTFKNSLGVNTKQVHYVYDGFDRLVARKIDDDGNGTFDRKERYVYDGEDLVLVFDVAHALTDRFLHGPATDQVFAQEDSLNNILWSLTDNQGTVRDVVNDSGVTQNHIKYDAFGNVTAETNSNVNFRYAFTGRFYDEDIDLQYNRARWYDATIGRWLSEDPIGFAAGDTNLSRYVGNSASNANDPDGLDDISIRGGSAFWNVNHNGFWGESYSDYWTLGDVIDGKYIRLQNGRFDGGTILISDAKQIVAGFWGNYGDISGLSHKNQLRRIRGALSRAKRVASQRDQSLAMFQLLYGKEGQIFLDAYRKSGGVFEFDADIWGDSDLDYWGTDKTTIQIDGDITNPIKAAHLLWGELQAATNFSDVRCHLPRETRADDQRLQAAKKRAVAEAGRNAAQLTEAYLAGISIVNEGMDFVITIDELSTGNLAAAVGFFPLIPAGAGKFIKVAGAKNPLVQSVLAKLDRYPKVIDARTGRHIQFPSGITGRVPKAHRVVWNKQSRANFIAEWHRRGYPRPRGGWDNYDIHHIQPREFGGSNDFLNLVPVERGTHQREFNKFWEIP